MLIEFSVANYRSFKDVVTFSMVASNDDKLAESNVFAVDKKLNLLKSAVLYGANASGKSNLIKALTFMRRFMRDSSKDTQSTDDIPVEPFRLSTETEGEPSFFELVFVLEGEKYRYGFEATSKEIVSEWLYRSKTRETVLFEREGQQITSTKAYKADGIADKTRPNALFLSVSAQFNVAIAVKILNLLETELNLISELETKRYENHTINCLAKGENSEEILNVIRALDVGFVDLKVKREEVELEELMGQYPEADRIRWWQRLQGAKPTISVMGPAQTIHRKFDQDGNSVSHEFFDIQKQESDGTRKAIALAGLIVEILKNGEVFVVDELDSHLHPLMTRAIIQLFNSAQTNPNNAQLIFTTHDTNLLSHKLFRRDQIWFAEKTRYAATDLYSLMEYKGVRNDASFEKDYILGRYGAVPYIGDFEDLVIAHGK